MQLSEIFIENLLPIALGSGGGGAVESFVADLAADKSWHAPLRFESSRISSTGLEVSHCPFLFWHFETINNCLSHVPGAHSYLIRKSFVAFPVSRKAVPRFKSSWLCSYIAPFKLFYQGALAILKAPISPCLGSGPGLHGPLRIL